MFPCPTTPPPPWQHGRFMRTTLCRLIHRARVSIQASMLAWPADVWVRHDGLQCCAASCHRSGSFARSRDRRLVDRVPPPTRKRLDPPTLHGSLALAPGETKRPHDGRIQCFLAGLALLASVLCNACGAAIGWARVLQCRASARNSHTLRACIVRAQSFIASPAGHSSGRARTPKANCSRLAMFSPQPTTARQTWPPCRGRR
ncbi:hypothetical protein K505DRAFT_86824 [Melanomma pulvis-pyrius CBS 109.77]|uniref:Uncharacterized protein n=1 Tax=Melanomma pulvis-pyrius CBS 109.77 TaxID=1314802 RepID=A0A6A6X162_9PLEO|nr:hypothetical protein K505DRAFT_86824 [Melanomma pulvis-pyrius CBS 109.77]